MQRPDDSLNEEQSAEYLGVSVLQLKEYQSEGRVKFVTATTFPHKGEPGKRNEEHPDNTVFYSSKLKIRYFRTTPQQADGAFARKFLPKAAKPRIF